MKLSTLFCAGCVAVATAVAEPQQQYGKPTPQPPKYNDPPKGGPGHGPNPPKPQKLVTSDALQKDIKIENLLAGSRQLQRFAYAYPDRNRVFGGKAHNDTVKYLASTLEKTGYYNVKLQKFVELFSGGNATATFNGVAEPVGLFTYSPSGKASAPLVSVANLGCDVADFPAGVRGNVALISRGTCTFAIKATNAKTAGASGAVIYDNVEGTEPLVGTLGGAGNYAPVVGITRAKGQSLLSTLQGGQTVQAVLNVNTILENRTTFNVIAETKGGDHNNVVSLGGHSDSVEAGPGINDDGSGIIGILEVAKALTKYKVKNAVRFLFWSAEEFGLLGSEYYVSQLNQSATELAKIRVYLNFDMIASPNYILGVYDGDGSAFNQTGPAGSDQIEYQFERFFKSKKRPTVPTEFDGRSDYGPFLDVGIPAGGLFTGAEEIKTEEEARLFGGQAGVALDANYHQAGDTVDNLNRDAYLLNSQAIADSVARYAVDLKAIPPRSPAKVKRDIERKATAKVERELRLRAAKGAHGHACAHRSPPTQ